MKCNENVIDIMERRGHGGFQACALVDAYWEGLRQGDSVPERAQIDPRGIEDALNYAFILESVGPGLARVRIAGMHLNELMGLEVRGMPISSMMSPASREPFARALKAVLMGPAKLRLSLRAEKAWGQPELSAEMLLLPLRSDMGDVTRVLGCLETQGVMGRAPRRFELLGAQKTMVRERKSWRQSENAAEPPRHFAEPRAPFQAKTETRARRQSYLRLVKSDNDEES